VELDPTFDALNALELRLVQAQQGELEVPAFLDSLLDEQVFVLIDRPLGEGGQWDEQTTPLVLTSESGEPMFAVFSAPEHATPWADQVAGFEHALQVDFAWLLGGIPAQVGIVLNPGFDIGMEMSPDAVSQLKERAAAITRAASAQH